MSTGDKRYRTVSQTAQLLELTVRTLHYWYEIHLLRPSTRGSESARLYTAQDIEKVQHTLIY
ncbi:MerR family transcriptional regulator [Rothia sp. CCM 9417]|uniref:MerR family transcriptional regulator n=1 Tax=unclassified Rothia (in: high G+C Gram-positive bacteria) TaxID=2689056 RepID=UPI003ADD319A